MKKMLFLLLFLLFLLIVNCVYQKTYTLYAMTSVEKRKTPVQIDEVPKNSVQKKENSKTIKKPEKSIPKTKAEMDTKAGSVIKQKESKTALSEENTSTRTETLTPLKEREKEEVARIIKVISHTPKVSKEELKQIKEKAINYLLSIPKKDRDALEERDMVTSRLQALIKRVLEERKEAIAKMEEVIASSIKAQAKRIEQRDQTSQKIIKNTTKGE